MAGNECCDLCEIIVKINCKSDLNLKITNIYQFDWLFALGYRQNDIHSMTVVI